MERHLIPIAQKDYRDWKGKAEICFGYPEVVSYNIYPKWYHDTPVKEYLKDLYDWVQTDTEGCSGIYIWQFCDCRVCDSWFGVRPRTMNNKGIVDEYRRPKLSYETVKRLFHSLP